MQHLTLHPSRFLDRKELGSEREAGVEALFNEYETIRHGVSDNLRKIGFASLYVTARCHLDCLHCYAEGEFGSSSTDVPTEQMLRIINQLGTITDRIQLTGGEVMTRRDPVSKRNDAPLLVEEIHRRGIEPIFQTTGMQLNESLIAHLAEHGVKWVSLSLDGPDEPTNTIIRQNPKAFSKVLEIIPLLKKHGLNVKVGTIVTKLTRDPSKLMELGKLLRELDVDNWKLMQFFPREVGRSSGKNEELLCIDQEEFLEVVIPIVKEYRDKIRRVTLHTVENYSQSPALLVQPTGMATVTIGTKDKPLGNVLELTPADFIAACEANGILDRVDENEHKTY